MNDESLVLVTGATGFIGSHVRRELEARKRPVRVLVRPSSVMRIPGVDVVVGELNDAAVLRQAVAGVGSIVHCAGRAHMLRETSTDPMMEFRRVNVDGMMGLAQAALHSGVQCFLLVSSVAAAGLADSGHLTDQLPDRPVTAYGISNREGELALMQLSAGSHMRTPIIRPPLTYGPGMKGNPLRLFDWLDRGLPLPFGAIKNSRTMVYVENLVSAICVLLSSERAGTDTYYVGDPEPLSTPDFIRRAGRALGRRPRLVPVPMSALLAAAWAGDQLGKWLPVPLSSDALESLCGTLVLDTSKLARTTGFRPLVEVDEGLRATADWYRQRRRKPRR